MIKAIVTDIEGTTSSIDFVHDVLFPYARQHIDRFVREHVSDPEIKQCLDDVQAETGRRMNIDEIITQLQDWIDTDQKITSLKVLQGFIWEAGYQQGDFHGHIYPDAYTKLRQWHTEGIPLYVYSSGSVKAQQLLFGHTEYGDLNPLFSGYFDTRIGGKKEAASYQAIIDELGLQPAEVCFLSDIEAELDAAAEVGMQTVWLVREGTIAKQAAHHQVHDFTVITLDN